MKRINFFLGGLGLLLLICAAGNALTLDDVGLGYDPNKCGTVSSEKLSCDAVIYVQLPYAGPADLTLKIQKGDTGAYNFTISSLNCSAGVSPACSWNSIHKFYANFTSNNTETISSSSNTGIYKIDLQTPGGAILWKDGTAFSSGSPVYNFRNFTAGTTYPIPVLNKYRITTPATFSGITTYSLNSEVMLYARNISAEGFFYNYLTPSCALPAGESSFLVYNQDIDQSSAYVSYNFLANINEYVPVNISSVYPANNSQLSFSASPADQTFFISSNRPEAVDAVAWYVNGRNVQYGSNYSYRFNASGDGTYRIEAQLEDNTCGFYPTARWIMNVGAISGATVFGSVKDSTYVNIEGAQVVLYCGAEALTYQTQSNMSGGYYFSGIPPGAYTIEVSAAAFGSDSDSFTLSDGDNVQKDFILGADEVLGSLEVSFWDEGSNLPISGFNFNLSMGSVKNVLTVKAGVIQTKKYNMSASVSANKVSISNMPLSSGAWSYYFSGGAPGYQNSSTYGALLDYLDPVISTEIYLSKELPASSNRTTLSLRVSPSLVSYGEVVGVIAVYSFNGLPISGAYCSYTSSALVPSSRVMSEAVYNYQAWVNPANVSGNVSVSVSCSRSGYASLTDSITFEVWNANIYTYAEWYAAPSSLALGDSAYFRVKFRDSAGSSIIRASCVLFNGSSNLDTCSEEGGGFYSCSFKPGQVGVYSSLFVNCGAYGYRDGNSSARSMAVYSGAPPTTIIGHCFNGVRDQGESDTDCGGSCPACGEGKGCAKNSDCLTSYCLGGACSLSSCSDGIKNGAESGLDCGGSCPACVCFENWDCLGDGSEECFNGGYMAPLGFCFKTNCSTSCAAISWMDANDGFYTRDRFCVSGRCSFSPPRGSNVSGNITNSALDVSIVPMSRYYFNDSGRNVIVSNCEEANNGFKVSSSAPVKVRYYLSDPAPYYWPNSAYVNQVKILGDDAYLPSRSALIPELCRIPAGSGNVSALIVFQIAEKGQESRERSIWAITFRDAFKFNVSFSNSSLMYVNASRAASCYYRDSYSGDWVLLNALPSRSFYFNGLDRNGAYWFQCNTSYREAYGFRWMRGSGSMVLVSQVFKLGGVVFDGFFVAFTGESFKWEAWYIFVIAILLLIVAPSLIILFSMMAKKGGKSPGGG